MDEFNNNNYQPEAAPQPQEAPAPEQFTAPQPQYEQPQPAYEQPQYQQAPQQAAYEQPQYQQAPPQYNQNPYAQPQYQQAPPQQGSKDKLVAGLLGIFLGALGIHKFYLGYTKSAVIMLLVSLLTFGVGAFVMEIIGLIEGIMYLTKSDAEFYNTYVANEKQWF